MSKQQIAADLERAFSLHGFAEPNVAQLKTACNVSLRTLYKYYPSKEAMIAGALEHRHERYLQFLADDLPNDNEEVISHLFNKLEYWMQQYAPNGCMSMNAMAAFPDNQTIKQAVEEHKEDIRQFLGRYSKTPALTTALYLLHEGASSAWPLLGNEAIRVAKQSAIQLLIDPQLRNI